MNGIKAINFKPFKKNTLTGFFDIKLPSGIIFKGCTYHLKDGTSWVCLPAKPYETGGHHTWAQIIEFESEELAKSFQKAAVKAVEDLLNGK